MKETQQSFKQGGRWIVPAGMLAASGLALAQAVRFPAAQGNVPGPALMPLLLAGVLAVLALLILWSEAKQAAPEMIKEPWSKIGLLLGVLCGYALLMPMLGFISGTALLLVACLKVFGHAGGARAWAFGLAAAFVLWAVFGQLMRVPLPEGLIG
jgi:hypothetical protein